jgi:primase-polymerase (primpol)-like protein
MKDLNFRNIPYKLRRRRQWILWREMVLPERTAKMPFHPSGVAAKTNDAETWSSFGEVLAGYFNAEWSGIGYVFCEADPYVGIDFDGIRNPNTGEVAPWARAWVLRLGSYSEVSTSETGIKTILRGKSPFPAGKKRQGTQPTHCDKLPGIEIYDRLRYFALTGWRLKGLPPDCRENKEAIQALCSKFWPPESPSPRRPQRQTSMNTVERATRYLDSMEPAISGQGGHNRTFKAACALVLGFDLSPEEAFPLLAGWNTRCQPPWNDHDLIHKLHSADQKGGERGYLK